MKALQAALAVSLSLGQSISNAPPSFRSGDVPTLPPLAAGGGQVLLELTLGRGGAVSEVRTIRDTPPFTSPLVAAVHGWQFDAAAARRGDPGGRGPIPAAVLVAAVYRPPSLLGPTLGEAARDVEVPSSGIPFPRRIVTPAYPPGAYAGGVVLLEVEVDAEGRPGAPRVLRSAPPFDAAAIDAMRRWHFTPAQRNREPAAGRAIVLFGFPKPAS